MAAILSRYWWVNSLWPSDAIWRQGSWSTMAEVMACCLTAPSNYLNQCWLIMNLMLWHPPENNFIGSSHNINSINELKNFNFKIITASPRGQWVKSCSGFCHSYKLNHYNDVTSSSWHLKSLTNGLFTLQPVQITQIRTLIARFMGPIWGPSGADRI